MCSAMQCSLVTSLLHILWQLCCKHLLVAGLNHLKSHEGGKAVRCAGEATSLCQAAVIAATAFDKAAPATEPADHLHFDAAFGDCSASVYKKVRRRSTATRIVPVCLMLSKLFSTVKLQSSNSVLSPCLLLSSLHVSHIPAQSRCHVFVAAAC